MKKRRRKCSWKTAARKRAGNDASAFSKMTTEMKLMMKDDSSQVAKLVMDGCNMGIQTLGGYINDIKMPRDRV